MDADQVDVTLRALVDPVRRQLLDALRTQDGQSVSDLMGAAPSVGKHAVLKHIGVLESALLVTSSKVGRFRLVYLNPVPIIQLAERWLDVYSTQAGLGLTSLQAHLKENPMSAEPTEAARQQPSVPTPAEADRPARTIRAAIVISATAERIWTALTVPEESRRWYFGTAIRSTFEIGSALEYVDDDGEVQIRGTVVDVLPEGRLVHTFTALWSPAVATHPESRYEWHLEPLGDALTKVTVIHSGITVRSDLETEAEAGSTLILSALKTLLETGRSLRVG